MKLFLQLILILQIIFACILPADIQNYFIATRLVINIVSKVSEIIARWILKQYKKSK